MLNRVLASKPSDCFYNYKAQLQGRLISARNHNSAIFLKRDHVNFKYSLVTMQHN